MLNANHVYRFPLKSLPLDRFCDLTGYTPGAIRAKIHRCQWAEGEQYFKAPDGSIHVIIEGYDRWVESNSVASAHAAAGSG